jgi:segregation and condensation protein A
MFSHHHVNRERLSVRQRMSDILSMLREAAFQNFTQLFRPEEGRMGVTVTFVAMLELMREGLIEIVQGEAYGQIHVRTASAARHLKLVEGGAADEPGDADADAENAAALAQPAQPEDDAEDDPVSTNEDSMSGAVSPSDNLADNPDPEASK